jgi:hypothetical protein
MINKGQAQAAVAMVIASDGQMSVGEALNRVEQMTGPAIVMYPIVVSPARATPAATRNPVAQPGSSVVHAALLGHDGTFILTCGTARGSLCKGAEGRAPNCPGCIADMTESLF